MLSFSIRDPDSFGRIKPEPKRIRKEPKVKTEIDVGTQGWQDLDVEQLLESESWRGVGSHQVGCRLEEIWKRHCTIKGHFHIGECQLQCHHYRRD